MLLRIVLLTVHLAIFHFFASFRFSGSTVETFFLWLRNGPHSFKVVIFKSTHPLIIFRLFHAMNCVDQLVKGSYRISGNFLLDLRLQLRINHIDLYLPRMWSRKFSHKRFFLSNKYFSWNILILFCNEYFGVYFIGWFFGENVPCVLYFLANCKRFLLLRSTM